MGLFRDGEDTMRVASPEYTVHPSPCLHFLAYSEHITLISYENEIKHLDLSDILPREKLFY